jgi:hypothetical protein
LQFRTYAQNNISSVEESVLNDPETLLAILAMRIKKVWETGLLTFPEHSYISGLSPIDLTKAPDKCIF